MNVFKKIMVLFLFAVSMILIFSQGANAFPSADEMQRNYNFCMQSDESWYRRFGQYVVAFDLEGATSACQNSAGSPYRPQLAACHVDGSYYYAGYYCQDVGLLE